MKRVNVSGLALATLLIGRLVTPAVAQQVPWNGIMVDAEFAAANPATSNGTTPVGDPPNYGTTYWSGYAVGPCDAFVRTGGAVDSVDCTELQAATDADALVGFPIHVPSGAHMQYLRVYYYGNSMSESITAGLYKVSADGVNQLIIAANPATTSAGAAVQEFGPFSDFVNNTPGSGYTYNFLAHLPRTGTNVTKLFKVYVYYTLRVAPAPATATFSDVPVGAFGFQHIEALAASGITGGCAAGLFCPDRAVTRAEMAIFLAKALGLHFPY